MVAASWAETWIDDLGLSFFLMAAQRSKSHSWFESARRLVEGRGGRIVDGGELREQVGE
jgi:hypothetical protein